MSRYEIIHKDKGLAFGHDRACGEFLMIWRIPENKIEREKQKAGGAEPEDVLVDMDTKFNKDFNKAKMLELIKIHGFDVSELQKVKERGLNKWLDLERQKEQF